MGNKKFFNSKTAKGLVSLITVIILLSSILATTFVYENNITANVAREISIDAKQVSIPIKEVNDIRELSSLNEGWYYIKNGYVYYLEHFDSYAPLFIRVMDLGQQNGLLLVDENGKAMFDESFSGLAEKKSKADNVLRESSGQGLGAISGRVVSDAATPEGGELKLVSEEGVSNEIRVGSTTLFGTITIETVYRYNGGLKVWERNPPIGGWKEAPNPELALQGYEPGLKALVKDAESRGLTISVGSEEEPVKDLNMLEEKARGDLVKIFQAPDKSLVRGRTLEEARTRWEVRDANYDGGVLIEEVTLQGSIPKYNSFSDALANRVFGEIVIVGGKEYKIEKATITKYGRTEEIKVVSSTENPKIAYGATESQVYIRNDIRFNFEPAPVGYKSTTTTASGPPQQPPFDPSNPEKFKTDMEDFIVATKNYAKAKEEEDKAKPLIAAAERWGKNPTNQKAKEEFYFEAKKWDIYQNTKANPAEVINIYQTGSEEERKISKEILVSSYNDKGVMQSLASDASPESKALMNQIILERGKNTEAYKALSIEEQKVADRHLENNKLAKKAGVEYIPEKFKFVNQEGYEVNIRQTGDNLEAISTGKKYEEAIPGVTAAKLFSEEQEAAIKAQGFTITPDGKIVDNQKFEYQALKLDPKTGWEVDKETKIPPEKIRIGGREISRHPDKYLTESEFGVYKDATGKLYDQGGNEIKDEQKVIKKSRFGTIDTEIAYKVVKNQIDTEKPESAKIGTIKVPAKTYMELEEFLKSAGEGAEAQGVFTKENPLVILDSNKNAVAQAYSFENFEGISKGTITKSSFKNGEPLLIKTVSEDGKVKIKEEKEFKEISIRDEKGKETKKESVLVTKSWVKIEEEVKIEKGKEIKRTFTTTKTYELDKDGKQLSSSYKDVKIDTLTGEPIDVRVVEKGNRNEAKEKEEKNRLHMQWTSRKFFADVERVLTQFQGLAYYQTLFIDEDAILRWQDGVDRTFATLYLGTEYWSSKICRHYLDGEDVGIAYAETPQGLAQIGAHIEATRTEPILTDKGREFIYKITFNVRNGDFKKDLRAPEEMNINIFLTGERTATVFKQDQKIKRGSQLGRAGRNAIVQESKALYTEVCIKFDDIPLKWKLDNKELCNTIVESSGEAATATATAAAATAGSQGSGTAGTTGEGDINDF